MSAREALVRLLLMKDPGLLNCRIRINLFSGEMLVSPLQIAVSSRWNRVFAVAKVLLDYEGGLNARYYRYFVVLYWITGMSLQLLELLLDNVTVIKPKTSNNNQTSLMLAITGNRVEICKSLIAHGADVNLRFAEGLDIPLILATYHINLSIEILWFCLHITIMCPLQICLFLTARALVQGLMYSQSSILLLKMAAKILRGCTALHIAVCSGHESVAKLLIDFTIDTAAEIEDRLIALFIAAWEGKKRLAKLLIAYGLDVNRADTSAFGC